jgi:hypothetical protein
MNDHVMGMGETLDFGVLREARLGMLAAKEASGASLR